MSKFKMHVGKQSCFEQKLHTAGMMIGHVIEAFLYCAELWLQLLSYKPKNTGGPRPHHKAKLLSAFW